MVKDMTRDMTRDMTKDMSKDMAGEPASEPPGYERWSVRSSLVEALDLFKRSGRDVLPVYDRDRLTGQLAKKHLIDEIARALGGAEWGRG